jgi:hypothetical protein
MEVQEMYQTVGMLCDTAALNKDISNWGSTAGEVMY